MELEWLICTKLVVYRSFSKIERGRERHRQYTENTKFVSYIFSEKARENSVMVLKEISKYSVDYREKKNSMAHFAAREKVGRRIINIIFQAPGCVRKLNRM